MSLEGFLKWAKKVGAYQVTDAFKNYKKMMEAQHGRQVKDTDKG